MNEYDDDHTNFTVMTVRQTQKRASHDRVLTAAAARLRRQGADGMAIAEVMGEARLTHGAFYAHFRDKADLAAAAFRHAMGSARELWFRGLDGLDRGERRRWLAGRYLSRSHRDDPGSGCALAALAGDAARGDAGLRRAYTEELGTSLDRLAGGEAARRDQAVAFLALCVGGIQLARAVDDPLLSDDILRACRQAAGAIGDTKETP